MPNPTISVIIPTYNREKVLKRCLKSLENQTFKDFEVIICDDGSTDNTKKIVNYFKTSLKIKYILLNKNSGGPAVPRNIAIKNFKGKYIAFLDSDDYWNKHKLKKCINFLEEGYDFVYHNVERKNFKSKFKFVSDIFFWNFFKKITIFNKLLLIGNKIINSSVVVRSKLLKRVGYFNESAKVVAMEDYLMWLKISKVTEKFKKIDEVLGFNYFQSDNLSTHSRIVRNISVFNTIYKKRLKKFSLKSSPWTYRYFAKYNLNSGNYILFIINMIKYLYCFILIFFNFKNLSKS